MASCSDPDPRDNPAPAASGDTGLTAGESRAHIAPRGHAAATVRTGPAVPITLPPGFALYSGARIVSNTLVQTGGTARMLVVFETLDPPVVVAAFYRRAAGRAGASLALDIGGKDRVSIGGHLPDGSPFALTAERAGAVTRAELSTG